MERLLISCTCLLATVFLSVSAYANYIEVPRFMEIGERIESWDEGFDRHDPGQGPGYEHEWNIPHLAMYENYFGEMVLVHEDQVTYDRYRADMSWTNTVHYLEERWKHWEYVDEGEWVDEGHWVDHGYHDPVTGEWIENWEWVENLVWHEDWVYHEGGEWETHNSVTEWGDVWEVPEPVTAILMALGSLALRRRSRRLNQ